MTCSFFTLSTLDEQGFPLQEKPFTEDGNGVMIRMGVSGDKPDRY